MIFGAGLPRFLWVEAVRHSVWLGVRIPSWALPEFITPLEKAMGCKPNLQGLLEWGISLWVKKSDARKLDPHAVECRFVWYDKEAEGYRVYWPAERSVTVEWDIFIDKDAVLNPGDVVFKGETTNEGPRPVESNTPTPVSQPTRNKVVDAPSTSPNLNRQLFAHPRLI